MEEDSCYLWSRNALWHVFALPLNHIFPAVSAIQVTYYQPCKKLQDIRNYFLKMNYSPKSVSPKNYSYYWKEKFPLHCHIQSIFCSNSQLSCPYRHSFTYDYIHFETYHSHLRNNYILVTSCLSPKIATRYVYTYPQGHNLLLSSPYLLSRQ